MLIALIGWMAAGAIPELDTPVRRARADQPLVELFSYEDYPPDALQQGAEGQVQVRLLVGVDGRAQECEVVRSSGNASLDQATCDILLERSRFTPARDAQDRAVPDIVRTRLNWQIEVVPRTFAEQRTALSFRHGDGTHCVLDPDDDPFDMPILYCIGTFGPFSGMVSQPGVAELRFEMHFRAMEDAVRPAPIIDGVEMLWSYEGEITLAPNGAVSNCVATGSEPGPNAIAEMGELFPPCAHLSERRFQVQEGGPHQARFSGYYLIVRRPR